MNGMIVLDRILEIQAGKGASAVRNVPNTWAVFDSHFPRFPVMPGVLIVGSLAELAARFLHQETRTGWRLRGVGQVRFCHYVRPGDQMILSVELKELSDDAALFSGQVRVDGKAVTTIRRLALGPCVRPADERESAI